MDPKLQEEVDKGLSNWIGGTLDNLLKRGFTIRQVALALNWAHEQFAIDHFFEIHTSRPEPFDKSGEELHPEPLPVAMPKDAPVPPEPVTPVHGVIEEPKKKKRGRPKGTKTKTPKRLKKLPPPVIIKANSKPIPPISLGDPDKGECSKCGKQMEVQNTSNARYTVFILWKCVCGWQHLQKRHDSLIEDSL